MEQVWSTTRRGLSVRSILLFVATVIMTALLWATFGSHLETHAASPSVTWKGESILYDGHQYFEQPDAKAGNSLGLAKGTHYYVYTPDATGGASSTVKAFVIYFAPGTDPPKETSATYVTYDYSANKTYSNPSGKKTVTVTPQGDQSSIDSCAVQGIGWIVCPITVFLADAMDNIYNFVRNFLVVQPVSVTNTRDDLYVAWNIMRTIANIAFIIVFLIIIYSQLTSAGVSNYGIKKLLPRLIIASILVNLSYIICSVAVDISNILGYSIQTIFNSIRETTFSITDETWNGSAAGGSDAIGWSTVAAFVLSGGAASVGAIVATGGTALGALYLLVPIVIGAALTILFVWLILAARQAIIIIMIVLSPLAFVAYLLPNTEQWFKKWRELFMSMLIFFPAFSLVFGGSQLAGGIIIQNATTIMSVIFGLAVQVAPLVITPLILRLSTGVLGRIAGIVNNPRKGLLDRTKNWAGARADMHRARGLSDSTTKNPFRKIAQRIDNNSRGVKQATDNYNAMGDNRWHETAKYHALHDDAHDIETEKKRIENAMNLHQNQRIQNNPGLLKKELEVRILGDQANESSERLNRIYEGTKIGVDLSTGSTLDTDMLKKSQEATRNLALSAISVQTAKRMQQNQLSKALLENSDSINGLDIRSWAGAPDANDGADSALTYAVALKREAEGKLVNERTQLIKHFKLDGGQRQDLAMGNNVDASRDGVTYTFKHNDEYAREAAIEYQMRAGSVDEIMSLIAASGIKGDQVIMKGGKAVGLGALDYRTTIADAIPANGIPAKGSFMGGQFINEVTMGNVHGASSLEYWAARSISGGKIKAEDFANNDAAALKVYLEAVRKGKEIFAAPEEAGNLSGFMANLQELQETARNILDPRTDLDRHASQAAKDAIKAIRDYGKSDEEIAEMDAPATPNGPAPTDNTTPPSNNQP